MVVQHNCLDKTAPFVSNYLSKLGNNCVKTFLWQTTKFDVLPCPRLGSTYIFNVVQIGTLKPQRLSLHGNTKLDVQPVQLGPSLFCMIQLVPKHSFYYRYDILPVSITSETLENVFGRTSEL